MKTKEAVTAMWDLFNKGYAQQLVLITVHPKAAKLPGEKHLDVLMYSRWKLPCG